MAFFIVRQLSQPISVVVGLILVADVINYGFVVGVMVVLAIITIRISCGRNGIPLRCLFIIVDV